MEELKTGDRVIYVGNPELFKRKFTFQPFEGREFIIQEGTSYRENGDHQYLVNLGRSGAYFFGSELKKIVE